MRDASRKLAKQMTQSQRILTVKMQKPADNDSQTNMTAHNTAWHMLSTCPAHAPKTLGSNLIIMQTMHKQSKLHLTQNSFLQQLYLKIFTNSPSGNASLRQKPQPQHPESMSSINISAPDRSIAVFRASQWRAGDDILLVLAQRPRVSQASSAGN